MVGLNDLGRSFPTLMALRFRVLGRLSDFVSRPPTPPSSSELQESRDPQAEKSLLSRLARAPQGRDTQP